MLERATLHVFLLFPHEGIAIYVATTCFSFLPLTYSYFEKGFRKNNIQVHATRPIGGLGIHRNFAYWPRGNLQVCIFDMALNAGMAPDT